MTRKKTAGELGEPRIAARATAGRLAAAILTAGDDDVGLRDEIADFLKSHESSRAPNRPKIPVYRHSSAERAMERAAEAVQRRVRRGLSVDQAAREVAATWRFHGTKIDRRKHRWAKTYDLTPSGWMESPDEAAGQEEKSSEEMPGGLQVDYRTILRAYRGQRGSARARRESGRAFKAGSEDSRLAGRWLLAVTALDERRSAIELIGLLLDKDAGLTSGARGLLEDLLTRTVWTPREETR